MPSDPDILGMQLPCGVQWCGWAKRKAHCLSGRLNIRVMSIGQAGKKDQFTAIVGTVCLCGDLLLGLLLSFAQNP